ncbi:TetR/AcrR family transcriptional regulator [Streptomyces sp. BE147]|uniref:TetR/AcrR family transcriptional regulator n=1 Tax=unclassified Streptomyces TaxID=2593676 RepID=UPI002E77823D|nr:TetR/AcrR family transcriptional regulator [Streptomyces sp. BE147]MEE1741594.1 TetR/AcrR family transcriptional regulator [Streptomyces sp. BE147]
MVPSAREALLNAALAALDEQPWRTVRMVDVAALAGVSRQSLYNEFGGKDGLARALLGEAADGYLAGVDRALRADAGTGRGPAAVALWTVREARTNALVKALLTGFWGERLPRSAASPTPAELLGLARDRAVTALAGGQPPEAAAELAVRCETVLRLALSYVMVPAEGCAAPLITEAAPREAC